MTAPSVRDDVTPPLRGLVPQWEFGCCAPRPVVGGTTWWRWIFHPQLDPDPSEPDESAVFSHPWSVSSVARLTVDSTALELRSGDFVAWWLSEPGGEFVWHDALLGRQRWAQSAVDVLVGQTITLRGRLWGGRHGGGSDDRLPCSGARVVGLTVLGRRSRIEPDRSRTVVERTARRDETGPPRFWSCPDSAIPPVEYREDALLMELTALAPDEAADDLRRQRLPRTLEVSDLRALIASVAPLAPGQLLTATRHTTERFPDLPPGFRPPGFPDEWTTQETDLLGTGSVTALHHRTRVRRLGPTPAHPDGAEREDRPDGTPLRIRTGDRRWRFHHWPNDPFHLPGDRELTAVESTARDHPGPPSPPRPATWQVLVDGQDPTGEVRAITANGRPCWTYTLPGPTRAPWAVDRVIVDAETGWLIAESRHGGGSQVRWSDVRLVDSSTTDDGTAFLWHGPSRPVEWFRGDWSAVHPVRRS